MPRTTLTKAREYVARLDANIADMYADRIDYAEFGRRNRDAWDEIHKRGPRFADAVLKILRETRA